MSLPKVKIQTLDVEIEELSSSEPSLSHESLTFEALSPSNLPFGRLQAWALRGGISILQQGFFAGAHFLMNVLLARWLAPASYGAFALAYAVFLLLLMLYLALFYEPLLVYGPKRTAADFSVYMSALVRVHFLVLVPLSLFFASFAPLLSKFYSHEFQTAFLTLSLLSPFLLLVWLCRAAFYAQLNTHAGTAAGACYFGLLITSICIMHLLGILSPTTGLGAMAGASLLVSVGFLFRFRKTEAVAASTRNVETTTVVSEHWNYGRWAAMTAVANWIPANIYYALLPLRFGLEGVATVRALMNLMYPLLHTLTALLLLLIPILVRQRERVGVAKMKRTVMQLIALFVPAGIVYLLLLALFSSKILHLLYAGSYADVPTWVIVTIGALPITGGIAGLLGAGLRALERPQLIFWSYVASAIVALVVGIPLTLNYGVSGTALALLLNDLPVIGALTLSLVRYKPEPDRAKAGCDGRRFANSNVSRT